MSSSTRRPVAQLTPAERIEQVFMISQPQLRTTSRGDYYIAAFLSDSTGKLNGRMWQASETIYAALPNEGFVFATGRTENYQGALQMVIEALRPVDISEVNLEDFLPYTDKDIPQMFDRLKKIIADIKTPHLAQLAQAFLEDEELMRLFQQAPAAAALHHAYIGGLLEHTLALLELGRAVLPLYPELDADLVMMGLFLHDIGKTSELDYNLSFQYSDQGRLVGHLVKGALLIEEKVNQLHASTPQPFPVLLKDCLIHLILSHHGLREFGCPVMPSTPEAFAVHYLDNLDSKIHLTFNEIKKDPGNTHWTNFIRALDAPLLKIRTHE
jgi:3'-5' exoribonuclease